MHVCYVNYSGSFPLGFQSQTMTGRLEQRFEGDEVTRQQRMASSVAPARRESACARVFFWGLLLGVWGEGGGLLLEFALFQPLDVMAQLQCRPQFQTHIFHDHVAAQEHQSFSINLLQRQRTRRVVSNCCEERRRKNGVDLRVS